MKIHHIITEKAAIVKFPDKVVPVLKENPHYDDLCIALRKGDVNKIIEIVDMATVIKRHTHGQFYVQDDVVMVGDQKLPPQLSDRLLEFVNNKIDCRPLIQFWDNLSKNPSEDSRNDLYGFLEHNNVRITSDGCFVAYKRITQDFKDIHTESFDNSIGAKVKMDRDKVNPNRNVTCSVGLHVAAFDYAEKVYPNGVLVLVKVNPKDVVAVPVDYNQQKMRVCEYEVLEVVDKPRTDLVYQIPEPSIKNNNKHNKSKNKTNNPKTKKNVVKLKKQSSGRLRVPGSLVRQINGLGYYVKVMGIKNKLFLTKDGGGHASLMPDLSSAVTLNPSSLEFLPLKTEFEAFYDDKNNRVVIK